MTIILDILVEHLEEIEFLWAQRTAAIRSAEYVGPEIMELDDRIDAHLQGLIVGGEACIPFAEPLLSDDDPFVAFAGAWCLAKQGFFEPILNQFEECNLDGVAEALCHAEVSSIKDALLALYASENLQVASAAAFVLATHQIDFPTTQLQSFLTNEDPTVRKRGWMLVSRMKTG